MKLDIIDVIKKSIYVKEAIINDTKLIGQILTLSLLCIEALKNNNKIIFAGNGGSFADAQHLSAEFTSRFLLDRDPLASINLGANNSSISAIGNDYGFEQVFSRELKAIANQGDIFIPITTSGNSKNIINAVIEANKIKIKTLAFSGSTGGNLIQHCECICVPSTQTARIQECHILIGHIVCEIVEKKFFHD